MVSKLLAAGLATIMLASVSVNTTNAAQISLYDGTLGTLPGAQGWLYLTTPLIGAAATQTAAGGVTTLDTTPVTGEMAGYFGSLHPSIPVLDRVAGYTVTIDLRVLSEVHVSNDRAGFSIIALSQDLEGLELAFWEDEIWVQSGPAFLHAEGVAFDTTNAMTQFALTILGTNYFLFADGTQILTGALRNYSAFGPPYTLANFLFFGDDTSSAAAEVEIATVGLRTGADVVLPNTTVPPTRASEPGALALFGLGLMGLGLAARRKRKTA